MNHFKWNVWAWPLLFLAVAGWIGLKLMLHRPELSSELVQIQQLQNAITGASETLPLRINSHNALLRYALNSDTGFSKPQALYLGTAHRAITASANGVVLERLSLRPEAEVSGLRQSYLFLIPSDLLHSGGNTIELTASGAAVSSSDTLKKSTRDGGSRSLLGGLYFGPRTLLERHFRQSYAVRVTLGQITAMISLFIALIAASLWLSRPKDTLYGWFGLGVAFWMVYLLHFLWFRAPLVGPVWLVLIHVALAAALVCLQKFNRGLLAQPDAESRSERAGNHESRGSGTADASNAVAADGSDSRGDRILQLSALVCSAVALLVSFVWPGSVVHEWTLNGVLRLMLLALGINLVATLIYAARRTHDPDLTWLSIAALLGLSFGVLDSLIVLGVWPQWLGSGANLMFHLVILPLVLVFGFTLLRRFKRLLDSAEAQAAVLDVRAQHTEQQLEREYQARQLFESERLLIDERHRLATDLHDGAGSLLVSLLAAVRKSGLTQAQMEIALVEAIADLRLVMDSIDSTGSDLAETLGQFRSRMEPRLTAAGLKSVWRTATLREGLKLSPRRTLNIFRALQEAIVNVIKHSGATEVLISAKDAGAVLELRIQDNGCGLMLLAPAEPVAKISPDAAHTARSAPVAQGRGLKNLHQRMKSLGGYAQFDALASADSERPASGLCVKLYVPIPAENETKW